MACTRQQLNAFLDALLTPARFEDYCPNGLQVEGREEVHHLVTGVTASQALLNAARERGADAILVHHGYFWRGEDSRITGMKAARLRTLIAAEMSLFAYHLPLDCHPEYGNNATLGRLMGVSAPEPLDHEHATTPLFTGLSGSADLPCKRWRAAWKQSLSRAPLVVRRRQRAVHRLVHGGGAGLYRSGRRCWCGRLCHRRSLRANGAYRQRAQHCVSLQRAIMRLSATGCRP